MTNDNHRDHEHDDHQNHEECQEGHEHCCDESVLEDRGLVEKLLRSVASLEAARQTDQKSHSEQMEKMKNNFLSSMASIENARKSDQKLHDDELKNVKRRVIEDFLPVMDAIAESIRFLNSFDKESDAIKPVIDCINIVANKIESLLKKHKIRKLSALIGEQFDSSIHTVVSTINDPDLQPGSIVHVVTEGYALDNLIIRHAAVIVAKNDVVVTTQ